MAEAPTECLVRAWGGDTAIQLRAAADEGDGNTLIGHFAVYDRWTEINSKYEGHFMERVRPSAFDKAFAQPERIKVLFDHGKDPSVGNKPLGMPTVLESRDNGAYYEVPLFDASYVNDLKPAIRAGALGASFRFSIPTGGDVWNDTPERSAHNPTGLPERDIIGTDLYEFGPVTFPAYPDASAGLRSLTDEFVERMLNDPVFLARLVERAGLKNVEPILDLARGAAGEDDEEEETSETPGAARDSVPTVTLAQRRAALARLR